MATQTGSLDLRAVKQSHESAQKTATTYITAIDENGITVHAEDNVGQNYAQIDANGMEIYKGGNSVAKYSDTSRVGQQSTRHIEIKDGGLQVYQDASTVMAHIGYGSGNSTSGAATAPYYILGKLNGTPTLGNYSLTEGYYNVASGAYSHAEGAWTVASRAYSHAEGYDTEANGNGAHAEGWGTIAQGAGQTVIGQYNIASGYPQVLHNGYLFIIGNGTGDDARSNAMTVDESGNVDISGNYKVNGTSIADFIITQGSSATTYGDGYWRWREWASGKVEIWYAGSLTLNSTTSTSNGVIRREKWFNFPNSYSLNRCTVIVNGMNAGAWCGCGGVQNSSSATSDPRRKFEIMAYGISTAPAESQVVNVYICGEKAT